MTAGTMGNSRTCPRCSVRVGPHDRFCDACGTSVADASSSADGRPHVAAGPPSRSPLLPGGDRDATTRYLCAAAQIDPGFADDAIAEFLVEPVRAIPPTPGVDAASVLREAVAARARRRIRDGILLLLLVILVFVSLSALVLWFIVGLLITVALGVRTTSGRRDALVALAVAGSPVVSAVLGVRANSGRRNAVTALVVAGVVVLALFLLPQLLLLVGVSLDGFVPGTSTSSDSTLGVVLIGLLIAVVIAADEFTVHRLVYTCFRPDRFRPDGDRLPAGWERTVRTLGQPAFKPALARVVAAAQPVDPRLADVVVHRGFDPFVGAGDVVLQQLIALPLDPDEGDDEDDKDSGGTTQPRGINVVKLHEHVANAIGQLRTMSSLGPGRRFEGLSQREQVLMPSDRLVTNLHLQPNPPVLWDVHQPPATQMDVWAARVLADNPQEWARYYQCFRVEAWDRDLTTSCFLHAGTDQSMLFLEWTFCALLPIRASYRDIDRYKSPIGTPLVNTLLQQVVLPATTIRRLRSVFHRFKPIVQRQGEVVPDRYGAGKSLRELAAADDVQTYFQEVDVVRYVKILDAALIRAVGDYLQKQGYSVVEFQRQARAATYDLRGANVQGTTFGKGASVQGNVFGSPAGERGK
ncbi:MAG: hypothetical protein ACRDRH_27545 [Pseudonocardia sp.]